MRSMGTTPRRKKMARRRPAAKRYGPRAGRVRRTGRTSSSPSPSPSRRTPRGRSAVTPGRGCGGYGPRPRRSRPRPRIRAGRAGSLLLTRIRPRRKRISRACRNTSSQVARMTHAAGVAVGRPARRREPGEGEGSPFADPGAEQPDLPVYLGPTPANPFGGQAFDIFDVLEQAEASAAVRQELTEQDRSSGEPAEPVVLQSLPEPALPEPALPEPAFPKRRFPNRRCPKRDFPNRHFPNRRCPNSRRGCIDLARKSGCTGRAGGPGCNGQIGGISRMDGAGDRQRHRARTGAYRGNGRMAAVEPAAVEPAAVEPPWRMLVCHLSRRRNPDTWKWRTTSAPSRSGDPYR